ncbi:class I SAM-dependent methyltransferase [Chryseolinea lacunae]|uniref:Class I SAM-dependent methyltransferase n=1 Tax=Chryseolinea lacunae TaxID=2801331 RepID=A0ABS1KNK3_9BACT|nr:class I SAM-dependent methyltransferase [Chryseolinea lacunae]MBL0741063.1 class I SAM-dependent methyltransferase [Chryseolinea lacunae]
MSTLLSFRERTKKIEGWLSEAETDLLMVTTIQACASFGPRPNIVEIGSYQGKSTVAIGGVVKALFPLAKVFAIDPHDGVVGALDKEVQEFPPSLLMFRRNIETAGLGDVVELIRDFSYNVKWFLPIHMIFIDALHDYSSVSADFRHFFRWVVPQGHVAFHDYSEHFPGVVKFVDELVATGECKRLTLSDSLIVIQKI